MPLKIYDLEKEKFAEENVGAEGMLRFLYSNPVGKLASWGIVKRKLVSYVCGKWADSKISSNVVEKFVSDNGIDASEFLKKEFSTFNEFFTRKLKDGARPVAEKGNDFAFSFPSDGRHLALDNVSECGELYVKGEIFKLEKFLGSRELASRFAGGSALVSRLSPVDYHRFHAPVGGVLAARREIKGGLFSVSPLAVKKNLSIFWKNKRVLNVIESTVFGMVAFVEIGATNVGTIINSAKLGDSFSRGDELGFFRLGGSCVITIFEPSKKIRFIPKLEEMGKIGVECYAKANSLAGSIEKNIPGAKKCTKM